MSQLDFTKPVITIEGIPVRILATDAGGLYPVVGILQGSSTVLRWTLDGLHRINQPDHMYNLIQAPESVKVDSWINVFSDGSIVAWRDRISADRFCRSIDGLDRVACVKLDFNVHIGTGLSTEVTSVGELRFIDLEAGGAVQ